MARKKIIALCLALAVVVGGVLVLAAFAFGGPEPDGAARSGDKPFPSIVSGVMGLLRSAGSIRSDGRSYPVVAIDAVPIVTEVPEGERLPVVGDRETLLKLLLDRGALYDGKQRMYRGFSGPSLFLAIEDAAEPAPPQAMPGSAGDWGMGTDLAQTENTAGGGAHSQTNEQVEGVSEGDVVKTDGKYIYILSPSNNKLRIVKADGSELKTVSTVSFGDLWGAEFYLIGNDRIAIVGSDYLPADAIPYEEDASPDAPQTRIAPDYYMWHPNPLTVLLVYDVSDREAPAQVRRISMEGDRVSTRVIGGVVYLVTNKDMWGIPYSDADSQRILPYCLDTAAGGSYEPVGFDRMYYIPDSTEAGYLLVGAVDVYGDEGFEPEAYLGAGSDFYMSQNAMYVASRRWGQRAGDGGMDDVWAFGNERTDIMRFAIDGTDVTYTGMGTVGGLPINQYSLDEYKGHLRIATTDWAEGTYVTVLRTSDMRVVGRTEALAPGERMQSMRFMGDMGYVVTFQNTDPLFTVDLSDPNKPKVLGELKIPGFSQYLHPAGDGLLLGIGRDTQEIFTRDSSGAESTVGFQDSGMKASLFDVSDPFDPKEVGVLRLGEGYAEVSNNPRALMCDPSRGLYGFTMERWSDKYSWSCDVLIVSVDGGRLSIAATLKPDEYISAYNSRLCFIGNALYIVHDGGIAIYDYGSFAKIGSMKF